MTSSERPDGAVAAPARHRTAAFHLVPAVTVSLAVTAVPITIGHDAPLPARVASAAPDRVERVALFRREKPARGRVVHARTVAGLIAVFETADFRLHAVRVGKPVPRLFVRKVPADIRQVRQTAVKKSVFLRTVLPLILKANESILRDRARLTALARRQAAGWSKADRAWLAALAKRYDLKEVALPALLERVDIVPPSLALAQAIVESGWGTSLAARSGNALFGQMAYGAGGRGIAVRQGGVRARIAGFRSLMEATEAYVFNLNTHFAYRRFRQERARLRAANRGLSGHHLAGTLLRYSELGVRYVRYIQGAIRIENLGHYDTAQLSGQRVIIGTGRSSSDSSGY